MPPHFAELDRDEIAAIVAAAPLACVVAQTAQGLVANHIPLLADADGSLVGHVALANDMHRVVADGQPVLAVFRGADGYVSPNYYPSKAEHHRHVPTWNYEAVHMAGKIVFRHDDRSKRAAVGLLTRHHERRLNGDAAWRMADAPRDWMETMLAAIVAFRIAVTQVIGKAKLSQNRDGRDHAGAVAGMRASGQDAVAGRMARRLARDG
ncbi:MAG: FMN-binding negative transcriptional regulator [Gemmobacter sp.]